MPDRARGVWDLGAAQVDVPVYVVFEDEDCFEVGGEEPAECVEVAEPG